jgi:parallel beta-helix repeat protein
LKKKVVTAIMLALLLASMMTLVFNSAYGTCMHVNPDSWKYKSETNYKASTLLTNLEYPTGLWIKDGNVFLTETAGRNTAYGGKICLDKYNILTGQKTMLVNQPECSDAVVVASDNRIYLTSYQGSIPGENGTVSVVDPQTNIETHLLNIEIASCDMFIDSNDNITIIGSSDLLNAKSIYLLPAEHYTNPSVLKTGLGRTWCISKSGTYTYFSDHYAIRRFNGTSGTTEMFVGKSVMSISFSSKYLFYADYFRGTVGRIDIKTKSDETLISGLNSPINVRYDESSNRLYFLEAGTDERECKDGTLKVITFAPSASVAFIYSTDLASAQSYKSLLQNNGVTVDLVLNSTAPTWNYSGYKLIIIGSDTGWNYQWKPESAVPVINGSGKPILGLGFGGSCFFDKLSLYIGWGRGWEGNVNSIYVVDTAHRIFHLPNEITIPPDKIIQLYTSTGHIGIYMPSPVAGVTPLGRETHDLSHYPLIQEDTRYVLWGFSNSPAGMTQVGKDLFVNMVLWLSGWTLSTRYPWPMFHHDLIHTGYTESPGPNTNRTLWKYTASDYVALSSPAVVDGKIYVGSEDNKTYCLDASTGAFIWSYATGGWVESSPAVVDGRVYIGSRDYRVYCLDASTGAHIWNYTTGGVVYSSSPAVADGKVYIGSYDRRVYCLDAYTGAQVWNYTTGDLVDCSPAVVDGRVYVGSHDCKIYCLDAYTGALIWSHATGGYIGYSSPAVVDGRVYVGSADGKVYCFYASTGEQAWNYTTGSYVFSSPAVAYGRVYVGSYDHRVYCLDALTGAQIWNYTTGSYVFSSPAVADGKVYVGSYDSKVYCFNAYTGDRIWSYTTGWYVASSPAVSDGVVFIGSLDKAVYALGDVIRVPENYVTIQAAINAAAPGATISIALGTYHDSLVINKPLIILGRKGSGNPVFDGGGSGIAVILLPGASGSTISGIIITHYNQGVFILNSSNCKIYDNTMSLMVSSGIALQGSSAANNRIYNNIFQGNNIAINLTKSSINNMIYHNSFVDNAVPIYVSMVAANAWDDGYPSGGNYWSALAKVDLKHGPLQNEIGSDGIVDINYTIAVNNVDRYPLVKPFSTDDIGITSVTTSKTVIGQGSTLHINVKILNYGLNDETFTITVRANVLIIATPTITLTKRNSITIAFAWNTTGFVKGNYTIWAYAWPVPGETDTTDNTLVYGTVKVTIPGDVDGNFLVDIYDVTAICICYDSKIGQPLYNPNCDLDGNGIIDIFDVTTACITYGQKYP